MEKLPFPIVLYPGHYGAFFAFQEDQDSPITFCSCAKKAIDNYLAFRLSKPIPCNSNSTRMFVLDSMYFPKPLVERLMRSDAPHTADVANYLLFKENLCHECNQSEPFHLYCVPMYGSGFKQQYGWYINKQGYEFGVEPISNLILADRCPGDILNLIKLDPNDFQLGAISLDDLGKLSIHKSMSDFRKQCHAVWNLIENEVRIKFGQKRIGESWTSETKLFYLIQKFFPSSNIIRHYRPDFLQGLEIDIFITNPKIGIEYQGEQHFRPLVHWGGEGAFTKLKERDSKKQELCKALSIPLIYFKYDEELCYDLILSRIGQFLQC